MCDHFTCPLLSNVTLPLLPGGLLIKGVVPLKNAAVHYVTDTDHHPGLHCFCVVDAQDRRVTFGAGDEGERAEWVGVVATAVRSASGGVLSATSPLHHVLDSTLSHAHTHTRTRAHTPPRARAPGIDSWAAVESDSKHLIDRDESGEVGGEWASFSLRVSGDPPEPASPVPCPPVSGNVDVFDPSAHDFHMHAMRGGCVVVKYSAASGLPAARRLWVNDGLTHVCWSALNASASTKPRQVAVADIKGLRHGVKSDVFAAHRGGVTCPNCCFSIVLPRRTLDFALRSECELFCFYAGLHALLQHRGVTDTDVAPVALSQLLREVVKRREAGVV